MAENKGNGRGGRRESGSPTARKSSHVSKEDAVVLREMTERGLKYKYYPPQKRQPEWLPFRFPRGFGEKAEYWQGWLKFPVENIGK